MSIEEALTAFVGIEIPKAEMEKGIPFVSFVIKEGEGAVFVGPLPLSMADGILKDRTAAGSEVLYRVDHLRDGQEKFASGIHTVGKKSESFLELLGHNTGSGNGKAGIMGFYRYLESHLALCRLERLAQEEIAFMEKEEAESPDYREANSSYYKEVLSYVEAGRRCLNSSISEFSLPPFPQRSVFMAKWYRDREGKR